MVMGMHASNYCCCVFVLARCFSLYYFIIYHTRCAVSDLEDSPRSCCQILLNKIDLVDDAASLEAVEARIRTLNKRAPVLRCSNAAGFDLSELLDVRAFDLKGVLEVHVLAYNLHSRARISIHAPSSPAI